MVRIVFRGLEDGRSYIITELKGDVTLLAAGGIQILFPSGISSLLKKFFDGQPKKENLTYDVVKDCKAVHEG
jgi:hypothetical protein